MIFAAIAFAALWLAAATFGPLTFWRDEIDGANGRNWPGVVVMSRKAKHPTSVWAQEAYEAQRKLTRPWELPLRLIGKLRPDLDTFCRRMELLSHEIEVQTKWLHYGVTATKARHQEAWALSRYPQFHGWPVADIVEAMEHRTDLALAWVDKNSSRIERQYRKAHSQ